MVERFQGHRGASRLFDPPTEPFTELTFCVGFLRKTAHILNLKHSISVHSAQPAQSSRLHSVRPQSERPRCASAVASRIPYRNPLAKSVGRLGPHTRSTHRGSALAKIPRSQGTLSGGAYHSDFVAV